MEILATCYAVALAAGICVTLKIVGIRLAPIYKKGFDHMLELMKRDGE